MFKRKLSIVSCSVTEYSFRDTVLPFESLVVKMKTQHIMGNGLFCVYFQELEDVFSQCPQLLQMDLSGNPVCKKPKYRDRLITVCKTLGEIFIFLL